jgi:hypothetical protein
VDTQAALDEWHVAYAKVDIKRDKAGAGRVRSWTGFESVPTLVIAAEDGLEPCEAPLALRPGASPRGIDRGCLLTEPNRGELRAWLAKHGMLEDSTGGPKANPADPRARAA